MKDYNNAEEIITAYHNGEVLTDEVIEWFKDKTGNDYVYTEDTDEFVLKDDTHQDEETGKFYSEKAHFIKVYNNQNNDNYIFCHEDTANDIAFYCEQTNKNYHSDVFELVRVERSDVCLEACRDDLFFWESDDSYHWDSEPEYADIPEYHSCFRPHSWQEIKGLGVELEIFLDDRKELNDSLPSGIFGETDGSLDEECGIELVGAPFLYDEYKNHETPWKNVIETALTLGAKSGEPNYRANYGMHVSISRKLFTDFTAAKFIVFMNMQADLCKLIADRDGIYEGSYFKRTNTKECVVYSDPWGDVLPKKQGLHTKREIKTEKYEAVMADTNRLEVRIFKSTLNYNKFLKNVEFVQAVKDWTERKTTSAKIVAKNTITKKNPSGTCLFFAWLNDQDDYINLKNYLIESASGNPHIIGIDKIKV